jgi:tricorn protease interacting factor F2/3
MNVKRYHLFMDVNFTNLSYVGKVRIEMSSPRGVEINAVDLRVKEVKVDGRKAEFSYDGKVIKVSSDVNNYVEVDFEGRVTDLLMGFYRAPYEGGYVLTTQFEAIGARRMFPCIDHPNYKASFRVEVAIDKDLDVISNMPVEDIEERNGRKIVKFKETPRMSTYLLYLGIGRFEQISTKLRNIDLYVATPPGKALKGEFAMQVAQRVVDFYENYFGIPYQLPKLHLIAVPEFSAGAMENWGAITFRETALLVDQNSSEMTKRRVAEVVAHELAHQWFGDLVTMKWWDDLWLNESFATFMSYKAVNALFPSWRVWEEFLVSETSSAMFRDSLKTTHPVHVKVEREEEIEQIFDDISYGKGASVLRMIEDYIGEEDFRQGVSLYLKENSFSNAEAKTLWESLQRASGKPVIKIMDAWLTKSGHPVVKLSDNNGQLRLTQSRFLYTGEERDLWPIPLSLTDGTSVMRFLFDSETLDTNLDSRKPVKLNLNQTGFYRVRYTDWTSALRVCTGPADRWGILSDAFSHLLASHISVDEYLRLAKEFVGEREILPARELTSQLSLLRAIKPDRVRDFMREFLRSQMSLLEPRRDENSLMFKGLVAENLALVDEEYAKAQASKIGDYFSVDPNLRMSVLISYARVGERPFEVLSSLYDKAQSDEERNRVLMSMFHIEDKPQYALSFSLLLSGKVKRQDIARALIVACRNPYFRDVAWSWIKVNFNAIRKIYEATGTLSRVSASIIPFLGLQAKEEVESFFSNLEIPEASLGIRTGLEILQVYSRLR